MPVKPDSPYLIEVWETEEGLPENSATAMVQTPDGYIWFGTFAGLVRFDGAKFTVFNRSNLPELPGAGIVNLHLDQRGRLWVSAPEGLARLEDGRWSIFGQARGWTGTYARTFAEGRGKFFITSADGKIFSLVDAHFVELPAPPGEPNFGYCGTVDGSGDLWVFRGSYSARWDGRNWTNVLLPGVPPGPGLGCGLARDGGLWLAGQKTLLKFKDGWIVKTQTPATAFGNVWSVHEDKGGAVWVASYDQGLARVAPDGQIDRFTTANGLSSDNLRFAFEDREGNYWIGSSGGGLMRFKRRTFSTYGQESGLPDRNAKSIATRPAGPILVGTFGGGVAEMTRSTSAPVSFSRASEPQYIQTMLCDHQQRIWVGTDSGLFLLQNGKLTNAPSEAAALRDINALFEDSQHRLWIGAKEGVLIHEGSQFRRLEPPPNLPWGSILGFAENPADGSVWLASSPSTLFRYKDEVVRAVPLTGDSTTATIRGLWSDADGSLWIATSNAGLGRIRNGQLRLIGQSAGLPAASFAGLVPDDLGFLWVASNHGILRIALQALRDVADGKVRRLTYQVFNRGDGLGTLECGVAFQPSAAKDSSGRLWFATIKGVSTVDPRTVRIDTNPPPVRIESVRFVNRKGVRYQFNAPFDSDYEIPPGSTEFEAEYSALSFTAPEKVRFFKRLSDQNRVLVASVTTERSGTSAVLPPGQYSYQITAANHDGVWNDVGDSLSFTVLPYYWQTGWFRGGLVLALLIGTSGTVWRTSRKRVQRALEKLEHHQRLAEVQARLATVLESTSDFVGFGDPQGRALYINRAGRRLVGLGDDEDVTSKTIPWFHPDWAANKVLQEGLPTAIRDGLWSGETALRHCEGEEIPVSQVIVAHKGPDGTVDFFSTVIRDIREAKRTEAALRHNEELFRAIVEDQTEMIVRWRPDGTRTFVNSAYCRLFGMVYDEAVGTNFYHLVAKVDREAVQRLVSSLTPSQPVATFVHKSLSATIDVLWQEWTHRGLFDTEGCLVELQSTGRDITKQKNAELALSKSEEKFSKAFRSSPDAICISELDTGRYLEVNEGHCELFGYSREEVIGRSSLELNLWQNPDVREQLIQALQTNVTVRDFEIPARRRDGEPITILMNAELIELNGKSCLVHTLHDVTERRKMERALRESEARKTAMLENALDCIVTMDHQGRIVDFNPAAEKTFGYAKADALGKSLAETIIPPSLRERHHKGFEHYLRTQEANVIGRRIEVTAMRANGSEFPVELSIVRIPGANPPVFTGFLRDITERKRVEDALRLVAAGTAGTSGRDFFRWMAQHLALALETKFVLVGALAEDRPGRVRALALWTGSGFVDDYEYDLKDTPCENVVGNKLCAYPEGVRELFPKDKDLATMAVEGYMGMPLFDRNRKPIGLLAALHDQPLADSASAKAVLEIFAARAGAELERLRADEALRASEQSFRQMAESINEIFWLSDSAKNQMLYISPAYERVWGRTCASLFESPRSWIDAIHPQDREAVREAALTKQATGEYDVEFRIIRPDGSLRWIRDRAFPVLDAAGAVYRIAGVAEEITERRQAIESLRKSEERLMFAQRVGQIGSWELDLDAEEVHWSEETFRIFGCDSADFVPSRAAIFSLVHPEDRENVRSAVADAVRDQSLFQVEYRIVRPDGAVRIVSARGQLHSNEAGEMKLLIGTLRDVTERKLAEETRLKLEAQLRQSQKMEAIGTMAGGVAHDFNNILGAIVGNAQLAAMDVPQDHPASESLSEIRKASERGRELVKQLLMFSRGQEQQRGVVRLDAIIREVIGLLRASLPSTIQLQTSLTPDTPSVLADAGQMHQVLVNLCNNAAHAMGRAGGRLEIRLTPFTVDAEFAAKRPELHPGAYARLSVSDTGPGIDAEILDRIFEPFFTTKAPGEGTGLGLAMVHGIVTNHDGAITVYSQPGLGATFDIYLPAVQVEGEELAADTQNVPHGTGQRVLFVDDEELLASLGRKILERLGYQVTTCSRAQEALDVFRANPGQFDLVVTDQTMPAMTGLELSRALLEIRPDLPILLTTGYLASLDQERIRRSGIRDVLFKPNTIQSLGVAVHQALAGTAEGTS